MKKYQASLKKKMYNYLVTNTRFKHVKTLLDSSVIDIRITMVTHLD